MKMSKRIITVILTLAVLITGIALSASAEEVTVDNYSNVLDYYEEPAIFAFDFSNEGVSYESSLMMTNTARIAKAIVTDANAPGGKYLSLTVSGAPSFGRDNLYFNWNSAADSSVDDFYFDATISADKATTGAQKNYPLIKLIVGDAALDDVANGKSAGVSIASFNFRAGKTFSYLQSTLQEDGTYAGKECVTSFVTNPAKWYDISVTYSAAEGKCSITITDTADASNTITVDDVFVPVADVKNVRLGVHGNDGGNSNGAILMVSKLLAAGGTVRRDLLTPQQSLENYVLKMCEIFNDDSLTIEQRLDICTVLNKMISYGFTSETEEVNAAVSELRNGGILLYSNELDACMASYASLSDYYEKRALVDANLPYADILDSMDISILDSNKQEEVRKVVSDVYDADLTLKKAETDSLALIEALKDIGDDISSKDYSVLKGYYEAVKDLTPDATYEGVGDLYNIFNTLVAKVEQIELDGDTFISLVNSINDPDKTFIAKYDIYVILKDSVFTNETYPGVTEALAVYNNDIVPYMELNIGYATNFVNYVAKADYAVYVSAKEENLDLAESFMNLADPDFAGVAEAKAKYNEIRTFITAEKAKAEAYVNAVAALDGLDGDALVKAIETALSLQKDGNVLGVDGVTEANIKLNRLVSSRELADKYCEYFIRVVNSIAGAETLSERRALIHEAQLAEGKTNASYSGVSAASDRLEKEISAFNRIIDDVNAQFENVMAAAVNTSNAIKATAVYSANSSAAYTYTLPPAKKEEN